MYYGQLENSQLEILDTTLQLLKLSCVSFTPHSRIFLVGGSSISEIEQCL